MKEIILVPEVFKYDIDLPPFSIEDFPRKLWCFNTPPIHNNQKNIPLIRRQRYKITPLQVSIDRFYEAIEELDYKDFIGSKGYNSYIWLEKNIPKRIRRISHVQDPNNINILDGVQEGIYYKTVYFSPRIITWLEDYYPNQKKMIKLFKRLIINDNQFEKEVNSLLIKLLK